VGGDLEIDRDPELIRIDALTSLGIVPE